MNSMRILDCTLRDGGRLIDCKFPDENIGTMIYRLTKANIDIIEVGFLRDARNVDYLGNSTFFTSVEQITPFLPISTDRGSSEYVAFIDYGMFDFDTLSVHDGKSIDGIRFGFTKKNFKENKDDILKCATHIKNQGYKLFVQGVNTPGYSDKELLDVIDMINEIKPVSFGIVDTYGSMNLDDLRRIYSIVNHNVDNDICIDFHSHNNFQLSYALSQEIISLAKGSRNIIIDATLLGMGKSAGNLNTELIAYYLSTKMNGEYCVDDIYDMIDDYIMPLREENEWGFSLPAMISGIYQSHPNNVLFITNQYRISAKDMKNIISKIDPATRQRYDYDNIRQLYKEYNSTKIDDSQAKQQIEKSLASNCVLLVMPGKNLDTYSEKVSEFIVHNNPVIISTSFIYKGKKTADFAFYANSKRYELDLNEHPTEKKIITSNIKSNTEADIVINYESLIEYNYDTFENSSVMLLKLLLDMGIKNIFIAGFDGFSDTDNYFSGWNNLGRRQDDKYDKANSDIVQILKKYADRMKDRTTVKFLTPSIYSEIFGGVVNG